MMYRWNKLLEQTDRLFLVDNILRCVWTGGVDKWAYPRFGASENSVRSMHESKALFEVHIQKVT